MRRSVERPTAGIGAFCLFVFVLTAVPKMNIKVGPVPVYLIDFLILYLLTNAQRLGAMRRNQRRFAGTVITILLLAVTSEVAGIVTFGNLQESVYIIIRTALAFSVFYLTGQYVRTMQDIKMVLKAIVIGCLVTSAMMVLTSLPMTRAIATDLFLSNSFLEPAAASVSEQYSDAGEGGVRGRTLVGVSILGASFINVCWPLAALLVRWPGSIGVWRALALAACVLAPMGVLMSYSRGPILGSVLIILAALFIGLRYIRRGIIFPVAVGVMVILFVGVGSQIFFFDRLTNRTTAMFEEPLDNERETERVLAYVEPFEHVAENPRFFFFGEGIATRYSGSSVRAEQEGKATHAVFAMSYYAYGMLAAFLYMSLLLRALFHVGKKAIYEQRTLPGFLSQPLLLSLIALLPWAAFGHAAVSTPRGAMLFFLVFGLVSSLVHFQKPRRRRQPMRTQHRARRRHLAFG